MTGSGPTTGTTRLVLRVALLAGVLLGGGAALLHAVAGLTGVLVYALGLGVAAAFAGVLAHAYRHEQD